MVAQECIFCKIIAREIPAKVIERNDKVIVIQDISPKAPIHYLIIPLQHRESLSELQDADAQIPAQIAFMARELSKKLSNADFRLIINNGSGAGQSVFHLHAHFLAGNTMSGF